eukprot:m.11819 g.11819  ORF g.11819 m.11819 type:complete len:196 (+) comp4528_c0_seq2:214-801(+)
MDYYDIDTILAEDQDVPCIFASDVIKLGHLNPLVSRKEIRKGTKISLPFWLVKELKSKGYITTETPKMFTESYRQALTADSTVVNLHDWNPYFFQFGMEFTKLVSVDNEEAIQMATSLLTAFGERYRRVMDISQNAMEEDTSTLTRNLDMLERKLFEAGHVADKEFSTWQRRNLDQIKMAVSMEVASGKKRKRGN